MPEKHTYSTSLRYTEQRKGTLSGEDMPNIEVATPPEFPKGHPGIWSPEHLFVASAEVCLMTTFLAIAENSKLEFREYSSEAVGTLEKTDKGFLVTEILIKPVVVVGDEELTDKTVRVLEKAEKYCLISNSMNTEVCIEPQVKVG